MTNYKEIVTKTVKSKCKKTFLNNFTVTTDYEPNTILGCWIINHQFRGNNNGGSVVVNGSFDVNVWYSYDDNKKTGVATSTYTYNDLMNCKLHVDHDDEIIVKALKQPSVTNVKIENNNILIDVEKELGVEVIGEDLVKINYEEENDDYLELLDDIEDPEIESINPEYLD